MIDHVSINVSDLEASRSFYTAALRPLGYSVSFEWDAGCGLGTGEGNPPLWLIQEDPVGGPVHLAFAAPSRDAVGEFHEAALGAGGKDNGAPGVRERYGPTYYAAYAYDPDGNNVEAVCMRDD